MKKCLIIVVACMALASCSCWQERWLPETPEERKAVAELEAKLIGQVPGTISGHDQDWDDVIVRAHQVACKTVCRMRLYEMNGFTGEYTGRVREVRP